MAWEWPQAGMPCRPNRLSMPWCARRLPGGGFVIADTYNFACSSSTGTGRSSGRSARVRSPPGASSSSLGAAAGRGRYLADTYNNRVVETDRHSRLLWHFEARDLFWPRCTFRGPDGRTVIADSRNDRILVVEHGIEKVIAESATARSARP